MTLFNDSLSGGTGFGPWRPIPLADSSDNYPNGKFPGDPAKYDAEGNYAFEYVSQPVFVAWYTTQVHQLGGEVQGDQYRLPLTIEAVGGLVTSPEDALAAPEFVVQTRIFPES